MPSFFVRRISCDGQDSVFHRGEYLRLFTRNPRGGAAKKIDPDDAAALRELLTENSFGKLVAHAPYTLNPCAADKRVREFAYTAMADDLERMEYLPGNYYNFHPGSHVGQGITEGIKLTSELLNDILVPGQSTMVLLETMAGKGSEIGSTFEQLADVISAVRLNEKVGVCLDTCHVYDGGYNIAEDLDGVLENFDRTVGLERLKAVHLNDTMNDFGSKKDRHQKIGHGHLGFDVLTRVINHPSLKNLPFILETPNDLTGYAEEIRMLRTAADSK